MKPADSPRQSHLLPLVFVFQAYLVQGLAEGILRAVIVPQMAAAGAEMQEFAGITAWGILPWVFKFIWAPWLDAATRRSSTQARLRLPQWVFRAELGAALLMGLCMWLPLPLSDASRLGLMFFGLNCGLALQDAGTDAFAIDSFPGRQRNLAQTLMQLAHHLGTTVLAALGVGTLVVHRGIEASQWTLFTALLLSAGLRWVYRRGLWKTERPSASLAPPGEEERDRAQPYPVSQLWRSLGKRLGDPKRRELGSWRGLRPRFQIVALASTAMLGHAATSVVAAGFLLQRLGWTPQEYQIELSPLVSITSLATYLLLLPLAQRIPTRSLLVVSGAGIGLLWAGLGLAQGIWDQAGHPLIWGYAVAEAFLTALFFVALYAEFMRFSQGPLRATYFVGLMALLNLSRFVGTWIGPELFDALHYAGTWIAAGLYQFIWSVVAFVAVPRPEAEVKERLEPEAPATQARPL